MMSVQDYFASVAVILATMGAMALLEIAVPLAAVPRAPAARRRANLAMTAQVLIAAFLLSSAVTAVVLLLAVPSPGLMALAGLPAPAQLVVAIVVLDFAYGYVAHRTMHAWPVLWRFHRVHHSDGFVDVTTSYRTHPVEIVWRHLWLFGAAWIIGAPVAAIATFRVLSAVNGIFEHANLRVCPALDAALAWAWVTPNMHKVHHSRERAETDSNYGNLLSVHDRLLGTFVPTERGLAVRYGLDDVAPEQSFGALLALPWREAHRRAGDEAVQLELGR